MEVFKLWDEVPGYEEGHHIPTLEYYAAEVKRGRGAIVIFPGGGYSHRAEHEGAGYAKFFNENGLPVPSFGRKACFALRSRQCGEV